LAFGPAETRETCIESAQKVFERLLLRTPDQDRLPFDTIAVVALNRNGEINQKKMKQLIRIFRPDQDGNLTMLDFVRSCDSEFARRNTVSMTCFVCNSPFNSFDLSKFV
jgi:hypothetical protein